MDSTSAPLYNALRAHIRLRRAPFHTPGHKGRLGRINSRLDLTELPDTDSLYHADGAIRAAEERAARLFGAKRTAFSAGGCSLAVQTMLCAAVKESNNNNVLFVREGLHRSAVDAMTLLDIRPRFVYRDEDRDDDYHSNLPGRIESEIINAQKDDIKFSAVYLTSPNYYGQLADVAGIAAVCERYDTPLLVDNAHGSHLIAFEMNGIALHPLAQGAAMTACSAHKTMAALTGGAFLNCGDERFAGRLKRDMAVFGSTSPSYLIMASLDLAVSDMLSGGMLSGEIMAYRQLARKAEGLRMLAKSKGMETPAGLCDPCRLTLFTRPVGMTGTQAGEYLRDNKIEPEYADESAAVLILTPRNSPGDLRRLERAITRMPVTPPLPPADNHINKIRPKTSMSPRAAAFSSTRRLPTSESAGKIAAEAVCPCPPGRPVVIPGEVIGEPAKELLIRYGICEIDVVE